MELFGQYYGGFVWIGDVDCFYAARAEKCGWCVRIDVGALGEFFSTCSIPSKGCVRH